MEDGGEKVSSQQPQGASYTYWVREATPDAVPLPVPKMLSQNDIVSQNSDPATLGSVWNRVFYFVLLILSGSLYKRFVQWLYGKILSVLLCGVCLLFQLLVKMQLLDPRFRLRKETWLSCSYICSFLGNKWCDAWSWCSVRCWIDFGWFFSFSISSTVFGLLLN